MVSFTLFLVYFLIAILLFKSIKFVCGVRKKRLLMKNIPGPPIENIILGSVTDMTCSPEERTKLGYSRFLTYGNIFCLWLIHYPVVVLSSAEYAELYFTMKNLHKSINYKVLENWLGQGLLTSNGPKWLHHRKLITPAFHFSILNSFCETFIDNAITLMEKLHSLPEEKPIDVFTYMHWIALENICETAMGVKLNVLDNPNKEYVKALESLSLSFMDRMARPWTWNNTLFKLTPAGRKMTKDLNIIHSLSNQVIQDKKRQMSQKTCDRKEEETGQKEGKKRLAFLDILLEACASDSVFLTEEELRDEVNTFMFEGHDTTAASLGWTLFLLGTHPEIQEKCCQEQDDIFQGSDRRLTMDDIKKMKYLEQVIKESLRLFPSVPLVSRQESQDFKMGEYSMSKDTLVIMNISCLHRNPEYFPDPDKFDPDRFTPEKIADRHPFAYVPFAAGSRNCIGQKFAMLEEKVILSYILRNFNVESLVKKEDIAVIFSLVIRSQERINVLLKRRKPTGF